MDVFSAGTPSAIDVPPPAKVVISPDCAITRSVVEASARIAEAITSKGYFIVDVIAYAITYIKTYNDTPLFAPKTRYKY